MAGKINLENFASKLSAKPIYIELYKLNVYGVGDFFKTHKDTPRSDTTFGSLIVVFPTSHEGGILLLRHGGQEWSFDSAALIKETQPSIAYVAFYSDVEHEITPVTRGHRITLTYNLYFADVADDDATAKPLPAVIPAGVEMHFNEKLAAALADNTVLPSGGYLGFGLSHAYPVSVKTDPSKMMNCLKGNDAVIQRACIRHSLQSFLRVVYTAPDEDENGIIQFYLMDHIVDWFGNSEGESVGSFLVSAGGKQVDVTGLNGLYDCGQVEDGGSAETLDVSWVADLTTFAGIETSYIAYGNDARIDHVGYTNFISR
ncbi:hypothetical protein FIBSPDRAFT_852764 [Athelia psychrophila]|uniref:Fe2OG dioxygenase domain-containing protein n=1 Tax=Athelia psychrophila TaxID=1759441 RepID=A0A166RGX2_9AGAM|nr:hypothetical protein FIBSPDRAFT_852764 [Fibularhizoctonia sp. CBS 109695]